MSKNFELMQQAEIKLDLPTIGEPAPQPTPEPEAPRFTSGPRKTIRPLPAIGNPAQEEARRLVQNIFLLHGEDAPRVVVFAAMESGNGCSWICAQVAETLASHKVGRVCIVDANLRSPALPEMFGVTNHNGLTDALSKGGTIRDFTKRVRSENLYLLSCGSRATESIQLLNSEVMRERIAELRKEFEYVLIDAPPLNTYSDSVAMGQLADGLVLVLEANSTRREATVRATEYLRAAQVRILGAILNKRTYPIPKPLYHLL